MFQHNRKRATAAWMETLHYTGSFVSFSVLVLHFMEQKDVCKHNANVHANSFYVLTSKALN